MKKSLTLFFSVLFVCGFVSLSDNLHDFEIENKTPYDWETQISGTSVQAYNRQYELELSFNVSPFMPSSAQCISNKRIKDIKFSVTAMKKMQKGDSKFAKMVERMKIYFASSSGSKEQKVYTSNLITNDVSFDIGQTVQIGTLYFLAPYTCQKVDQMKMKVTDITIQGRRLPPLEIIFKLNK